MTDLINPEIELFIKGVDFSETGEMSANNMKMMGEMDGYSPESAPEKWCGICLSPGSLHNPCVDKDASHPSACKECITDYVLAKIADTYVGSCPVFTCPLCIHPDAPKNAKAKLLPSSDLLSLIDTPEVRTQYLDMAKNLLTFQCGGCHKRKTLFIECTPSQREEAKSSLQTVIAATNASSLECGFPQFLDVISAFDAGVISVSDCYAATTSRFFPEIQSSPEDSKAWQLFKHVLQCVVEPERRANLHLRYLRDRPFITTQCCTQNHCFRCKSKGWHTGSTCDQNSSSFFDGKIVMCPACGINLTRGDGCNTITCVCKHQFGWSEEVRSQEQIYSFQTAHPSDTHDTCAQILCRYVPGDEAGAAAWRRRNRVDTNKSLIRLLQRKYGASTTQWCAVVKPLSSEPPTLQEARALWTTAHAKESSHCLQQHALAVQSVFLSMYPDDTARAEAALRITRRRFSRYTICDKFLMSEAVVLGASEWAARHADKVDEAQASLELSMVKQFISLMGNTVPDAADSRIALVPFICKWDRSISNTHLTFTEDDTCAKRCGSVSCYPAAMAPLTAMQCNIRFRIGSCLKKGNYISLGLVQHDFTKEGSNGVGPSRNTWGIMDTRDSSSATPATVYNNASSVCQWRKFVEGDVITVSVDLSEGTCNIKLNEEFDHTIRDIPKLDYSQYRFAATFASDHEVKIESVESIGLVDSNSKITQNKEYYALYTNFMKFYRGERTKSSAAVDALISEYEEKRAAEWELNHGWEDGDLRNNKKFRQKSKNKSKAYREFLLEQRQSTYKSLLPFLNLITGGKKRSAEKKSKMKLDILVDPDSISPVNIPGLSVNWGFIEEAICWGKVNKYKLRKFSKKKKTEISKQKQKNDVNSGDSIAR